MRRAFTLIEMSVSLVLLSILLGAMGSVVVLSSRVAPTAAQRSEASTRLLLDSIANDLRDAIRFTATGARAVQIEVADRNNDGVNETIRYEWSGVANTPILRTVNGNGGAAFSDNLTSFSLAYTTATRSRTTATAATEGPEQLLATYTGAAGGNVLVRNNSYPAQVFTPTLPAGTVSWRLTRLRFVARNGSGLLGIVGVQIRNVDSSTGLPSATVLDEQQFLQTLLTGTNTWYSLNFDIPGLPANQPAAFVLRAILGSSPMTMPCAVSGVADNGAFFTSYGTGTSSWSNINDGSLQYEIYGKATAPGTATSSVTIVQNVQVSVTPAGGQPASTLIRLPLGGER